MSKKKTSKDKKIKHEEDYVKFLKKRLESENFKTNVTKEEYNVTKKKYEKAKLKLRLLKNDI